MTMINIYNPLERKYLDETITMCNEYMLKVKVKDHSLTHTNLLVNKFGTKSLNENALQHDTMVKESSPHRMGGNLPL